MDQGLEQQHLEGRGVKDPRVLVAVRRTPRHKFVPPALEAFAYEDRPLSIGYGQTISQPYIVALMTELLDCEPHHTVLEIGTGSGYQAAVLSGLVKHIYSMEIVPELAKQSAERLPRLGYRNISVRLGDGYLGWREKSPFDRVILTAAPPQIPQPLIDQLRKGGKLVAPVGDKWQELVVLTKLQDGSIERRNSIPVSFVPMVHGTNRK